MKPHRILISPLDWGLGHAARCIPLVQQHLNAGHEVVLAATGSSAAMLQLHFPQLLLLTDVPAYNISYPTNGNMAWHMLKQAPHILRTIQKEHQWLQEKIKSEGIDEVISDNRYGLYSENAKCSLITHQLYIQSPALVQPVLNALVRKFANKFKACLIPDFENENNLSGALSHGHTSLNNISFIGPLSRFSHLEAKHYDAKKYFATAIISGPEPQRSLLRQKLTEVFLSWQKPCAILCGTPELSSPSHNNNIDLFPHLLDSDFAELLQQSQHIICRSGYSTIMDLHALKKSALLVPTPGQTEQEYLASYHAANHSHAAITQKNITSRSALQALEAIHA